MEHGPVWRVLLGLWVLGMSSGGSGEVYEVHMEQVSFDKAVEGCSGGGILAELSTQQEASEVLRRVAAGQEVSTDPQAFWVGLRKTMEQCVVPHLPLRGFRWLSDGSERWAEARGQWWEEPEETCTGRCAVLKAQTNESGLTRWGLLATACKGHFAFICKRTHGHPDTPLTSSSAGETGTPTTQNPFITTLATTTLAPTTLAPTTLAPTTLAPTPRPELEAKTQPEAKLEKGTRTKLCPTPSIPGSRWLELDSDPLVECWSGTKQRLNCSDGLWKINGSVLDPAAVCPGNWTEDREVEDAWAGLMMPVLVAVAVLVVLVVLAVVLVRCCLVRRSKDRAVRKAEKMAMKNKEAGHKDSMETTNEKERR